MKYKAIIFDMDGTIIYSEHLWYAANLDLLDKKKIALSQEKKKELEDGIYGRTTEESCQILKEIAELEDEIEALIEDTTKHALSRLQEVVFVDGFLAFHEKLRTLNIPTAIATNADAITTEGINTTLQLHTLFAQHIYNASHVKQGKPSPDIYLHAAAQLGIDPSECIAIEDSDHGIKAAKSAGMFCIGINSRNQPEKIREADIKIDHYDEIDLEKLV